MSERGGQGQGGKMFAALFGVAVGLCAMPFWVVTWLPCGDLGGHIEMFDVVARYGDPATVYEEYYLLPTEISPNLLSLLVARVLGPFIGAVSVAKLQLTFYAVGLPLSLLALARAFGRSKWLAFFACPLVFNAILNVGFVNQLVALPIFFYTIAVARRFGEQGGRWRGGGLALLTALLFFAHVIPYLIGLGIIVTVLVVFAPSWRQWPRVLAPLASSLLFGLWYQRKFVNQEVTDGGRALGRFGDNFFGAVFIPPDQLLAQFYAWSMQYFRNDAADEIVFVTLACIWLMFVAVSQRSGKEPDNADARPADSSWSLIGAARTYALEGITLCCFVAHFILPAHLTNHAVLTERVVILILLFLSLWPRLSARRHPPLFPTTLLVGVAITYPFVVAQKFHEFEDELVGGLPEAIASLPDQSFLGYTQWERENPLTHMGPLWHIPKAIHAVTNGGVTDDSFAAGPTTAIQYREGMTPARLGHDFWLRPQVDRFDYVLLRSSSRPTQALEQPQLRMIWQERIWWLFEVTRPNPGRQTEDLRIGGGGGEELWWDCPTGAALVGFSGHADRIVRNVSPRCRFLGETENPRRDNFPSPVFGSERPGATRFRAYCPDSQVVIGIHGNAAALIDAFGVICAAPADILAPGRLGESWRSEAYGGAGGQSFVLTCSAGSVAVGFRGRVGAVPDAVGIACAKLPVR